MVSWSVFVDFFHLTALLPIELCTSYVPKFRILRAHGLLTRSENCLLFSTASFQPLCKYQLQFVRKFLLFSRVFRRNMTSRTRLRSCRYKFNFKSHANKFCIDRLGVFRFLGASVCLDGSQLVLTRLSVIG